MDKEQHQVADLMVEEQDIMLTQELMEATEQVSGVAEHLQMEEA